MSRDVMHVCHVRISVCNVCMYASYILMHAGNVRTQCMCVLYVMHVIYVMHVCMNVCNVCNVCMYVMYVMYV